MYIFISNIKFLSLSVWAGEQNKESTEMAAIEKLQVRMTKYCAYIGGICAYSYQI